MSNKNWIRITFVVCILIGGLIYWGITFPIEKEHRINLALIRMLSANLMDREQKLAFSCPSIDRAKEIANYNLFLEGYNSALSGLDEKERASFLKFKSWENP